MKTAIIVIGLLVTLSGCIVAPGHNDYYRTHHPHYDYGYGRR